MTTLDWLIIAALLRAAARRRLVGDPAQQGHRRRLLPRRPQSGLVRRRRVDLRVEHRLRALVGLAGSGATSGVALAHYELHAWCLLVLGWVFVPFYMRSRVFTMPEFLERRFSPASRYVLSLDLADHLRHHEDRGRHLRRRRRVRRRCCRRCSSRSAASCSTASGSARCSWSCSPASTPMLGGMRAVAYNDAVQTVILIIGSALLTVLRPRRSSAAGASCARRCRLRDVQSVEAAGPGRRGRHVGAGVEANAAARSSQAWYFNGNYPWLGMLFCAPIIGLWYWCTDQYIVQRALGAPEPDRGAPRQHLRRVPEAAAGVHLHHPRADRAARSRKERQGPGLRPHGRTPTATSIATAAQAAFPLMVQHVLPSGLRGIVVAGLLAALMSSLAGVFNASSTLFTIDLYRQVAAARVAGAARADRAASPRSSWCSSRWPGSR